MTNSTYKNVLFMAKFVITIYIFFFMIVTFCDLWLASIWDHKLYVIVILKYLSNTVWFLKEDHNFLYIFFNLSVFWNYGNFKFYVTSKFTAKYSIWTSLPKSSHLQTRDKLLFSSILLHQQIIYNKVF